MHPGVCKQQITDIADVIPERLLEDGRPAASLMDLDALGLSMGLIEAPGGQLCEVASRMCARALRLPGVPGRRRSPMAGESVIVVHLPRSADEDARTSASRYADEIVAAMTAKMRAAAGGGARACALPVAVCTDEQDGHLVGLMADPRAGRLVFYDPHGERSDWNVRLMPMLTLVGRALELPLFHMRAHPMETCGIQSVHGRGLCAWYTLFVMTVSMLAWHRDRAVPVHVAVELMSAEAAGPLVYRAFRAWATSALWIASRSRPGSRPGSKVHVRRTEERRFLFVKEARSDSGERFRADLESLVLPLTPEWATPDTRCWHSAPTPIGYSQLHLVAVTWFDEETRLATVVGKAARDRQGRGRRSVVVRYADTGELATVPFQAVLWGHKQAVDLP